MPVHHHVLALLMSLTVHGIWVVRGSLRDWGARRRRCFSGIITSSAIDRRAVASCLSLWVLGLIVMRLIVRCRARLRKPSVPTIRHLSGRTIGSMTESICLLLVGLLDLARLLEDSDMG